MFDDPLFFPAQYFECKQADIEQINKKLSKKLLSSKFPPRRRGWRGFSLSGFHIHVVSIVGSLRDREVACSASDRQGSNFESCVWRTVSSQSFHHPQEVLLAQFSLYVHKGGLKPDSFHFHIHVA